jgi:hypothetical protein
MAVTHSPDYVEAMVSPQAPRGKLSQNPQLAPAERERLEIYEETWRDLEMRGFKHASVIRFAPWSLTLDGAVHSTTPRLYGVPIEPDSWKEHQPRLRFANGLSIPYTHYVCSVPHISVGTRFRGKGEADSYAEIRASVALPIDLARDMAHQQNSYKSQGGIVVYEGANLPQSADGTWLDNGKGNPLTGWLTKDERADSIEAACTAGFDRLLTHMKACMDQATSAHRSGSKEELREVRGNRYRQCVQYLVNVGVVAKPPSWFDERFSANNITRTAECPMCAAEVNARSVKCGGCGYIIDPFKAYGHLYTIETEGGLLTARRMTKEQLKTLGLHNVKPLDEHLEELSKASAKGSKKDKDKEQKEQKEQKADE